MCACANALSLYEHVRTLRYNRDGNWLMITAWRTMTDSWIVMLMSCGSDWPLHFRIFKPQLSFLQWHMRLGAQSIYVQNNSILWKSHWPPGYLVQINNISSYHSCSPSDPPKRQSYVWDSTEITCYICGKRWKLGALNDFCAANIFFAAGLQLLIWLWMLQT